MALASAHACDSSKEDDTKTAAEPQSATPEPAAAPERPRVLAFCVANMEKMVQCLDDPSFWNVLATLYAADKPELAANPGGKDAWVGIMKDATRTLHAEGELDDNCEATLGHTRWPTAAQMKKVEAARGLSCAEFGNAFGWMMFGEGVFHEDS